MPYGDVPPMMPAPTHRQPPYCDENGMRLLAEKDKRIAELEAEITWYVEQTRLCRLIHSGGDAGRHALQEDGGERARAALTKST